MANQYQVQGRLLNASIRALIAALTIATPLIAMPAPSSPFVAAGSGVWEAGGSVTIVESPFLSSSVGPVLSEATDSTLAYAGFRGAFGSNGFHIQVARNMNREAYGGSIWSDGFTVESSAPTGFLTFKSQVNGSVSGLGEMAYALYVSSRPFEITSVMDEASANRLGFWALSLPNSTRIFFTGVSNGCNQHWSRECGHVPFENFQGTLGITLTASVPFSTGQPLYVISIISGGVGNNGGVESFMNSADFSVSAPHGATLSSLSDTNYAQAVPEPSTLLELATGLAVGILSLSKFGTRKVKSATAA